MVKEPSWPDWKDAGKAVWIVCGEDENGVSKGDRVLGKLVIEDVGFDGEEEYPYWVVKLGDGRRLSFVMASEWGLFADGKE